MAQPVPRGWGRQGVSGEGGCSSPGGLTAPLLHPSPLGTSTGLGWAAAPAASRLPAPTWRLQLGHPIPSNGSLWSLPRSYIYQKRWVKLDADYLRYFDSEKASREKGFGGSR